jgi:hypothetical protein
LTEGDSPTTSKFIVQGFRGARKYKGGLGVLTPNLDVGLPVLEGAEKVFEEQEVSK